MKGKEHVLTEVNLMMMCYNLRRLMSIFDINTLKSLLKGLAHNLLHVLDSIRAVLSHLNFAVNNYRYKTLLIHCPLKQSNGKLWYFYI